MSRPRTEGRDLSAPHRWIDDDEEFVGLVDELVRARRIALDTEFHREHTFYPDVAVIQLAWDEAIVLVDALAVDLAPFAKVLESDARLVMHACMQDLEVLQHACGAEPRHLFDTQIAAGFLGHSSPSLAALCRSYLQVDLAKGDRLTDWKRRPLPADALAYAAADVEHLFELEDRLVRELEARDRLAWAEDECRLIVRKTLDVPPPEEAWWRIKEARKLKGRAAAIAQTVAAWREERARRVDRPLRFVLPDLGVVGVAQRPPSSVGALKRIRGVDDRHLRHGAAEELMAAIDTGRELSPDEVRIPEVVRIDPALRPAVSLVSAWVSQLSRDLDFDPALVATRRDIEAFLAGTQSRLDRGWRAELVADRIRRLVAGEAALAFVGDGRLELERRSGEPL